MRTPRQWERDVSKAIALYKSDPEVAHSMEDELLWEYVRAHAEIRGTDGAIARRLLRLDRAPRDQQFAKRGTRELEVHEAADALEVERLRDVRDKMFKKNALQRHLNELTEAEVERLRAKVAMAEAALEQSGKLLGMQTAEVEKLREDVAKLNEYGEDIGWIHAEEVERLQRIKEAARGVMGLYNVDKEYGIDAMSPEWGRLWKSFSRSVAPGPGGTRER